MPPHSTYSFKHALVQDTAYGTLLREPRRVLHARIVETLENQFAEIATSQPEVLAQHCDAAEWSEKAALYWRRAGEQAAHRGELAALSELKTYVEGAARNANNQFATLANRLDRIERTQAEPNVKLARIVPLIADSTSLLSSGFST